MGKQAVGIHSTNYNNRFDVSGIFNSSTNNIDSVVATVPDVYNLNADVYSINNASFSSFKFRLLDKETNLPRTALSLPPSVEITFKIIAK